MVLLSLLSLAYTYPHKSIDKNCSIRIMSKTNPITGKITFASKEKFKFVDGSGESSIDLLIVRQNKELTLRFKSPSEICVPMALEIVLSTQEGKKVPLKSNSKENCKGSMIFNFGGMFGKENFKQIFKEEGIQSIMFENTELELLRYDLKAHDKRELHQVFQCLLNV